VLNRPPEPGGLSPRSANIIYGHFWVTKYERLGLPSITILRDPATRVISEFRHWGKSVNNIRDYADKRRNVIHEYTKGDLSKFDFIGFQEDFEGTINRFEIWAGKSLKRNYKNQNIFPVKNEANDQDIEYIKKLNELDYEIYNEAVEKYGWDNVKSS